MKQFNFKAIFSFIIIGAFTASMSAQITTPASSPEAEVMQRVGITDITIHYNRPYVKEREVWGALVPYGFNNLGFGTSKSAPWRAGADYNTTIEFSHDVKIEGKEVMAGKYALFFAIEEDGAVTGILSSNTTSWGSYFYDEKEDVVRFKTMAKDISKVRELLTYEFNTVDATSATASLVWEKKEIPFKIEVDVQKTVMKGIQNDLRNTKGFQQSTWDQAAGYAFRVGDLDQALEWINASISGQFFSKETFLNLSLKSQILGKQGKYQESLRYLDRAVAMGNVREIFGAGTQLIGTDNDKALSILKNNVKKNKGAWPSNFGLARAYSAKGNYKKAIQSINKAMNVAPDNFKPRLQQSLAQLEKGEDIN